MSKKKQNEVTNNIFSALKYKREFKIGLVSFVILIAFIWGVNFIKGHNFFSSDYTYYAVYPSSGGLQEGRPVKINGVTVGIVSTIRFSSDALDSVTVRFDVSRKYRFTRNAVAQIAAGASLMSDAEMNILLAPGGFLAENGDTLAGQLGDGLMDMVKNTVLPIRTSLLETLASLDSVLCNVNDLLNQENKARFNASLSSLSATLENARTTTAALNRLLDENSDNVRRITGRVNTLLDSLSAEDLNRSVAELHATLEHLRRITEKIDAGEGTVGRLVNDPQMYASLVETVRSLEALLDDVKAHPKRYINVTVFGKKEPTETARVKDSLSAARLRAKAGK